MSRKGGIYESLAANTAAAEAWNTANKDLGGAPISSTTRTVSAENEMGDWGRGSPSWHLGPKEGGLGKLQSVQQVEDS